MSSCNKCHLRGNLGKDPEVKCLKDGTYVANLSVAISKKVKGVEQTNWIKAQVFGIQAEWLQKAKKGDTVCLDGMEYCVDEYEGKDGEPKRFHLFRSTYGSNCVSLGKRTKNETEAEAAPSSSEDDEDLPY